MTESSRLVPESVEFVLGILVILSSAYLCAAGMGYLLNGHVTWSGATVEFALAATLGVVAGWRFREQRGKKKQQQR